MKEILYTLQGLVILFSLEQYLRQNKKWDIVFEYLETGLKAFINWRSDANIIEEMKVIPDLFSKLAFLALACIFLTMWLKIDNIAVLQALLGIIMLSITTIFSFNWVFKHRETIKEFKPVMYIYGLVGLIILVNIFISEIYPSDLISIANQYNLTIPTKYEIAISFLFYFSLAILSFYVFMWIFALIFPISILIILFTTSKLSRYIRLKLNKQSFIGLIGVLQIVVLFGLYKYT